jgi:hypothetical protein
MDTSTIAFYACRWRRIPSAAYDRITAVASATGAKLAIIPDPWPMAPRAEAGAPPLPPNTFLAVRMAASPLPHELRSRAHGRHWLRALPCSGWLLPSRPGLGTGAIVAAVELEEGAGLPLDLDVLTTAGTLAQAVGARLVVVHAWTPIGESIITCPERGLGPLEGRRVLRKARRHREEKLSRLLEAVQTPTEVSGAVVKGPVAEVLRRVLGQTGADTLVLGYRGRSGVWGAVRGNLADSFANTLGPAVLAVRPGHPLVSSPTVSSPASNPPHARA